MPGHFTGLLNLLNLGLETGSLFGPLYLSRLLAIYLEAQSAVCKITSCCRGDGDVGTHQPSGCRKGRVCRDGAPGINKYIPKQQVSFRAASTLVSAETFLPLSKHGRKHKHV